MLGLIRRLRARIRNRRFDDDLAEELRFHEEMKREELERNGMSADGARAAARRALGNVTLMKEDARRVWIGRWLEILLQDARYAARSLSRQPVHTITVLVVQGANDPRVLQVESDEMVAAIKANRVPVEYLLFPDEGHGFEKRDNRIAASEAYVRFLGQYLRGGAAAPDGSR